MLSHNRPAFYMVIPRLFEELVEEMANRDLDDLVCRRLAVKNTVVVQVDLEQP